MNRIAYMVMKNIVQAPIWFYHLVQMGKENDTHTEQERYDYLRNMVKIINRKGRVSIDVHGIENLPKEDGFVMFPNHQGLYDSLALIEASHRPFGAVIKKEAANIILIKQVIAVLRGLSLDREDPRDGIRVITEVTRA